MGGGGGGYEQWEEKGRRRGDMSSGRKRVGGEDKLVE